MCITVLGSAHKPRAGALPMAQICTNIPPGGGQGWWKWSQHLALEGAGVIRHFHCSLRQACTTPTCVPEHPDHHPIGCVRFDTEESEFEGHVISFPSSCFLED